MSCLQNESILESLFDEVCEEFRISNKLTPEMFEELLSFSTGTFDAIVSTTNQRFEAMCQ